MCESSKENNKSGMPLLSRGAPAVKRLCRLPSASLIDTALRIAVLDAAEYAQLQQQLVALKQDIAEARSGSDAKKVRSSVWQYRGGSAHNQQASHWSAVQHSRLAALFAAEICRCAGCTARCGRP
jgi:hypothetical protein